MGYDGGFTKIRMKINNQNDLNKYELNLRHDIYDVIGMDNFYKFEGVAIDLPYLDNNWTQVEVLQKTIKKDIKNYELDDTHFTLINQDILGQYISDLHGSDDREIYLKDIKLLEKLYNEFDWENDTLVFSYSY